jgi:hypothetical protein
MRHMQTGNVLSRGLKRPRSATAGEGEPRFDFILHNSSFNFAAKRLAVRCIA